jgi:hypothetical protein
VQIARIAPLVPLPHGVPRVDARRVVSGIVHVIPQWPTGEGRPEWVWPAQDALQPLHPLEPVGRVRSHLFGSGG